MQDILRHGSWFVVGSAYGLAAGLFAGLALVGLLGTRLLVTLPVGLVSGAVWGHRASRAGYAPSGLRGHALRATAFAAAASVIAAAAGLQI